MTFPLRIILEYTFARKLNKRFQKYTVDSFIDITLLIVFIYRLILEYGYYLDCISSSSTRNERGSTYYEKYLYNTHRFRQTSISISNCIDFNMDKGPASLESNSTVRTFDKMIQRMINDIMIFMILFLIQLVIFATIATFLFTQLKEFRTFDQSLLTLFQAVLGNFDFDIIAKKNRGEWVGNAFLMIFLIMNMILLLNLLILILSKTYSNIWELKNVLYINEILKIRP